MAAPQRCPILALSSIYADILCRGTTELDVVAHVRERLVSCGQPRLTSEENEFQRSPNLGFSRIYTYTLYYRTAKFGMVTHEQGRVLGGQPCHCVCTNASHDFQR